MPATRAGRMGRRLMGIGWRVLRIYLLVALVLALFQTKLIFIGASSQGKAESVVSPPPGGELVRMHTAEGTEITGLFAKAQRADGAIDPEWGKRPTVLWFYGNAMCMADAVEQAMLFRRLDANVMLVDYAGYGMSGGEPSEQGCYDAAEAAYGYLLQRADLDRSRIVAAGWSLGGAVAIDLAARHARESHICGVMSFCTFTSMAEVGQWHYPIFPVALLLRYRFESERKIRQIHVPLLIGHGCRDSIVPFGMSERLAKAAGGKVTRLICEGADHNDFFDVGEGEVRRAAAAFLTRVDGTPSPSDNPH